MKVPLADNTIEQEELNLLAEWIKCNPKLTKGPVCVDFEKRFAEYLGSRFALFVNSGSSANLLIAQALLENESLKNKTVILPAVSWVTTVTPFMQLGYDVKLCDCDKDNLGIDVKHFEELCIDHNPSAVMLVHVLGHSNNMEPIKRICEKYDVCLLEDACEALGSVYDGKNLGTIGRAASFSFYYGHHISTIEGGMVVTNDENLYHVMLSIRSHGWGRDFPSDLHSQLKNKYEIDEVRDLYTFYYSGFNLRGTDLNAFIGVSQLSKVDKISKKRELNFKLYRKLLGDYWCQRSSTECLSSFAYGVLVENRLEVYRFLKEFGIETRPLICGNLGKHPFWVKENGECSLPNADVVHTYGIYLPNRYNLSEKDIKFVCEKFREVAKPIHF